MTDELVSRLIAICGAEHVSDKMVDRICYTRDCGPTPGGIPAVVVRPESTAEVSAIVKLANEYKKPIFIWGRSTTFIGSGIQTGCILMGLDLMDKIEKMDFASKVVTVQTGAVWHAVDAELNKRGWELGVPGPGGMFSCSIGGSVAYNAVPHAMTEYGMTGDHVISLEVVLPDGSIMQTGSAANEAAGSLAFERYANGPDLAGLFIGSCGVFGVITRVTFRIRRRPDAERFLFYAYDTYERAVDTAQALQTQEAATFVVGLFGGPKPVGVEGDAFLHLIIRDSRIAADERQRVAAAICESFGGRPLDARATERYWTNHMYSWLRNTPPDTYYANRPYTCPEVAGFVPTEKVKDTIAYLRNYEDTHRAEFEKYGIAIKCYDVYFSRNGGFVWIDTLYPELEEESWKYGLNLRAQFCEDLFGSFMSPGGIVHALGPYIMPKLGAGFALMRQLKSAMDPNYILNPGVLYLYPPEASDVRS
jgi:FAD/FMN-containing dehydrogenase